VKSINCRSCGSSDLVLVHDFGPQPLAGCFPSKPMSELSVFFFELDLTQCRRCSLIQVTNLPPIDEVFHDDYRYASSTVPDLVRHFVDYAEELAASIPTNASVLEFGSNDGVLLLELQQRGIEAVGIDASDNVASMARSRGLDVRTGFMTEELIEREGLSGRFDVVTCSNVFAHIDNIAETTAAVRSSLKPDGLFIIEVHDGEKLASEAQFDTIYHEHLTYFTEYSLRYFVEHNGFEFIDCKRTKMHGGGLRLTARMGQIGTNDSASAPHTVLLDGDAFSDTIERCKSDIESLVKQYGQIDGYGAAGRSQMFINMTGTTDCFARVFDDSPLRCDRYIVGSDISIEKFSPLTAKRKVCVILAWNYAPSIAARIRDSYDEIITVLPSLRRW
jgi:SAM-dependent methyltransferase